MNREMLLQTLQNNLENAREILALRNRSCRATQQIKTPELALQLPLCLRPFGDIGRNTKNGIRLSASVHQRAFHRDIRVWAVIMRGCFFFCQRASRREHSLVHPPESIRLLLGENIVISLSQRRFLAQVKQLRETAIDQQETTLEVLNVNHRCRIIDN